MTNEPQSSATGTRRSPSAALVRGTTLGAAAIIATGLLLRAVPDVAPDSDFALIDLQIQNVLHGSQALGAYSRFGWSHPGPLYFQLLAPLYWLSGLRHLSVVVGAMLLNVFVVIGVLGALRRYSATRTLWVTTLFMLGVYLARTWGLLASPWNAHVPILPLALLVTMAACAAAGAVSLLPAVVAVACLVVQAHVGFALPAVAVLIVTSAYVLVWRREFGRRAVSRAFIVAALVGVALWAVPLVSEVVSGRHNLREIFTFFGTVHPMDGRSANRLFAHYFVAPLTGDLQLPWGNLLVVRRDPLALLAAVQILLVIIAAVSWHRAKQKVNAAFAVMVLAASVAAFAGVHRLEPTPNDHAVYWVSVLGVLAWATGIAWSIEFVTALLRRAPSAARAAAPRWIFALASVAVLVAGVWQVVELHRYFLHESGRIEALTAVVRKEIDRQPSGSPLVYVAQSNWATISGVVLQLDRAGLAPHIDADRVRMFGSRLAPTGLERTIVRFADADEERTDFRFRLDQRPIGGIRNVFAYVQEPVPPASLASAPAILATSADIVGTVAHAVDGLTSTSETTRDTTAVMMRDVGAWIAFAPPQPAIAIRVSGEPGSAWNVQCGIDPASRTTIGLVRIGLEPSAQSADAYLRDLPACRQVLVSPARAGGMWLSEVQMLVRK